MLLDKKLLAPCGTFCGLCQYFEKKRMPYCSGCGNHKGNPFWGECKVYSCSTEHGVEHCGLCKDFPCSLFIGQFDPEHGQKNAIFRAGLLVYRKKAGTEKYLEMVKKTGSH